MARRRARNPRDFYVHDRYLGGFLDFGSLKTAARYAKHKFGCAPAGECVYVEQDEAMVSVNAARPHLARRVRSLRNPFNATKPAEWATMSKKLRKAWNRKHWRPEQWKCDLALKREATRQRHRHEGSTRGKGLEQLAEKIARQNPPRDTVRLLLQHPALARVVERASGSARVKILAKLEQVAERARTIRRSNPKRGRKKSWAEKVERERRKLAWSDRKRIEREELASGFAVNPRRRRRR
jgi:hypothetical protein